LGGERSGKPGKGDWKKAEKGKVCKGVPNPGIPSGGHLSGEDWVLFSWLAKFNDYKVGLWEE